MGRYLGGTPRPRHTNHHSLIQMQSALSLTTGQNIRFTPQGLVIDGEMTLEQWTEFLNTIHSIKSAYHCVLADHLNYGREKFGIAAVAIALEQAEFDLSDVLKAEAIQPLQAG